MQRGNGRSCNEQAQWSRNETSLRNVMEGVDAMGAHRTGKVTLRTHNFPDAEVKESPGGEFFVAARERFNVSRAVWAKMLRVSPQCGREVGAGRAGESARGHICRTGVALSGYPLSRLQTLPKRVPRSSKMHLADSRVVSVSRLFSAAGLPVCGPVRWNENGP